MQLYSHKDVDKKALKGATIAVLGIRGISMHPEAARMNNPRCTSCHQETTFCADCHRRVGVARDGPDGGRGPSDQDR